MKSRYASLASFMLLAACTGATAPVRPAGAAVLVYSNDVMGELEPCGCRSNPMGGVVRRSVLVGRLEKSHGKDSVLQVDAGNFLFNTETIPELLKEQAEAQAGYLIDAHNLMGHDIVVPGPKDFALGVKAFQKLASRARFDFLAANLRRKDGKPLLRERRIFTLRKKDGSPLKVGVFGIAGEGLRYPAELKVASAVETAREQVKALRKDGAHYILAVTHQGYEADKKLADAVKGIDGIVGGHSQSFLQKPDRVNGTGIYQSSFRNQYIGTLNLESPFEKGSHELVGLDLDYEPKGLAKDSVPVRLEKLVAEFKAAVAAVNTSESATLMAESHPQAGGDGETKYQTFPRCAECHVPQFDFWRKTRHADALTPLVKSGQIRNKECLSCHTVGLGDKQGFSDILKMAELRDGDQVSHLEPEPLAGLLSRIHQAKSMDEKIRLRPADKTTHPMQDAISIMGTAWAPVQCENCHQPGGGHPFTDGYKKAVAASSCLQCHTRERAPQWWTSGGKPDMKLIAAKMKLITCPNGDAGVSAD